MLAIRPDDWNFPLLLHVAGAALLVGTLLVAVWALLVAPRQAGGSGAGVALTRLGWWTLLAGVLPSWLLMRIAGQWIASKEGFEGENDPGWVEVGYATAEPGALVLLIALILGGLAVRRARRSDGGGGGLATAAGVLSGILLVAYLVAMWAMTTKPD